MKVQRAFRLTMLLLAIALVVSCKKSEDSGSAGPTAPGEEGGPGSPATMTVVASPSAIRGNGTEYSDVTVTVYDSEGDPVPAGVSVSFVASRGTITASAFTDASGVARARYTSAVGAGEVRINVEAAGANGFTTITLTSGPAAQIVIQSIERLTIGVQESNIPQTSKMEFQVRDAQGVPVGPGVTVGFILTALTNGGAGSGESLDPDLNVTDDDGVVYTVLRSGTLPGVTETVAIIASTDPDIVSRSVGISINTQLPVADNISVAVDKVNILGPPAANVRDAVTAIVFDQFHNPVANGTIVYFTTDFSGIQAADTTDDHGNATVDFITGAEFPPDAPPGGPYNFPYGFACITAQTADTSGSQITATGCVLLSGPTRIENVSPATFDIPQGGKQVFSFNVWDQNHNPLTEGTTINVSASAGTLLGDVDVTLGDTQVSGPGTTSFTFVLVDDDPGDNDPPTRVAITIKVESPNGNASEIILGNLD